MASALSPSEYRPRAIADNEFDLSTCPIHLDNIRRFQGVESIEKVISISNPTPPGDDSMCKRNQNTRSALRQTTIFQPVPGCGIHSNEVHNPKDQLATFPLQRAILVPIRPASLHNAPAAVDEKTAIHTFKLHYS